MTGQPISVRDGDGSLWTLCSDGTYGIRNRDGSWSNRYQGYSLYRIAVEFDGILSRNYDRDTALAFSREGV